MQPEEMLDSREIYVGKIIRVKVDTVVFPDGRQSTREVVEHAAAVAIVPIDDANNVLMVRQYRYPTGQSILEIPAGMVEEGESPDDTAQRELQEEIGFMSRALRPIGGFWTTPGFCDEFMYAYLAKNLVPSKLMADDDEYIAVEKVPLDRIPRLIRLGEIQDGKSIAALLMVITLF